MDKIYYIESAQLDVFFEQLKKSYKVFSPAAKENKPKETEYCYRSASEGVPLLYNSYRTVEPLKAFFTHP